MESGQVFFKVTFRDVIGRLIGPCNEASSEGRVGKDGNLVVVVPFDGIADGLIVGEKRNFDLIDSNGSNLYRLSFLSEMTSTVKNDLPCALSQAMQHSSH